MKKRASDENKPGLLNIDKLAKETIWAKGLQISVYITADQQDFFCLTDIARFKNPIEPKDVVKNWLRTRSTIEFLGLWETINNPNFKGVEFDSFMSEAGDNSFTLSPQRWIDATDAIGMVSKSGRYGGTFAHVDIAMEFASWVSSEFKLYIIKDYQRLKTDESHRLRLEWNVKRELSKVNYRIHTDAIKANLIPETLTPQQVNFTYASEADMLNVALFNMTAKQWREKTPGIIGNMRDYADVCQLIVLVNLESMNAELIKRELPQGERLVYLRKMAWEQMASLVNSAAVQRLNKTLEIETTVRPKKRIYDK